MLSAAKHLAAHRETLRCAQGDKILPMLLVKIHHRARGWGKTHINLLRHGSNELDTFMLV
jgi:hypothetical protein